MAEDENIYYIQKQENGTHLSLHTECVWQDAYTEVVAYEENVQDNGNLNITYVTDGNEESSNENYETAGEESQYYSVIETNETLDHDQTLQPMESQGELDLNDDFKGNLTIIQYPTEDDVKHEFVDTKIENCDNTIVEDDDQVILYKIEDSNELFAVQIARDADGNIQKYQYKVRQNEDGQLEAVPGTIQIQPEGTEQLICEDATNKEMTINQSMVEDDSQNFQSIYENSLTETIKTENDVAEEMANENEHVTDEIQTEETIYEDATNEIEVEQEYHPDDIDDEVVEKLDEENNHIEYLKQDEAEVLQHTGGGTYFGEEEEEFENVEYLQDDDDDEEMQYEQLEENYIEEPAEHILSDLPSVEDQTYVKQYPPNNQVEVLSNVLMEPNLNDTLPQHESSPPTPSHPIVSNTPKQILNKLSNITFGNESIELKRVNSGATAKQANKLTFLIVTHPETEKQNKHLTNNKKFRSILRPTIHQQSSLQKTVYPPVFKANCKQTKHKTDAPISKINNTVINITPSFNKGPRQPRKQVITPVDRVGSEIIIQAPEEKEIPVETYDLDAFSDEEYSPKIKPKKICATKKRGKKSTKPVEIVISDNSKSTFEDDVENKNESEIKKKEKPIETLKKSEKSKFDKVLPTRKRGRPGRPKLSEKNKLNIIEKEVISSGSIKGGQSGRPKFIRTTRKISNGKQKNDSKENEVKSIRFEKESNEEIINDDSGLSTPKRRGRPPKKYSPDDSVTRKRKSSNDEVKTNDNLSDKYFGFCSDSEIDDKEINQEEPESKKKKSDLENEKIDDLMSEMQDIHGVSDEEEQPAKIDEILDEKPTETETLLSILETSPSEKEDVLTRALKSANIITPSELDDVKPVEDTFLETDIKKSDITTTIPPEEESSSSSESKKTSIESTKSTNTSSTTTYKCAKCSKTFLKYLTLKTHLQEHNIQNKGKFNCTKCPRVFTFENALKFHEKTHHHHHHHNNLSENRIIINNKNFHCTHCTKSFKTMLQLKSHQLQHNKQLQCEKCSEYFNTRSEHVNHMRKHHETNEENIKKSRIFRRSTQDKREFSEILSKIDKTERKTIGVTTNVKRTNKSSLDDNTSSSIDVHRCTVCMKTFRQLAHLVMHREVHQKPTCSNCGQIFPFKHVLSEHMRRYCLKSPRIHTSIKKRPSLHDNTTTYDCEKCKKTFKNKMFYQNHMKMHMKKSPNKQQQQRNTGLRKSTTMMEGKSKVVDTTGLSAASISERRKSDRKQVPTQKVMPIRCEMCDLSFTTYTGLFRHTLSHPDIKEKCQYCDAGFETKLQLSKHLKTHVKNDLNIECSGCKKQFKTNDDLVKHTTECSGALDKSCNSDEQSEFSSSPMNTTVNSSNKNIFLTVKKSLNIPKRKLAHGGIPLPLKLKNKLMKRKL